MRRVVLNYIMDFDYSSEDVNQSKHSLSSKDDNSVNENKEEESEGKEDEQPNAEDGASSKEGSDKQKEDAKQGEPIMNRAFEQRVHLSSTSTDKRESKHKIESKTEDKDIVDQTTNQALERQEQHKEEAEIRKSSTFNKSKGEFFINDPSLKLQRYEQVKNTKLFQKFLAKEKETQKRSALENARRKHTPGILFLPYCSNKNT